MDAQMKVRESLTVVTLDWMARKMPHGRTINKIDQGLVLLGTLSSRKKKILSFFYLGKKLIMHWLKVMTHKK